MFRKIIIILLIFSLITVGGICYYLGEYTYYEIGAKDQFNIQIGKHFTIRLYENGSTGFSNCWINENKIHCIKKVRSEYKPGLFAENYEGQGGFRIWEFKGTSVGTDTIKISNCPIYIGSCNFFSKDSILRHPNDSIEVGGVNIPIDDFSQVDYTFIVKVSE